MNREKCINRNIAIASAIISGVNILTLNCPLCQGHFELV